jgi:hypothetical protein
VFLCSRIQASILKGCSVAVTTARYTQQASVVRGFVSFASTWAALRTRSVAFVPALTGALVRENKAVKENG